MKLEWATHRQKMDRIILQLLVANCHSCSHTERHRLTELPQSSKANRGCAARAVNYQLLPDCNTAERLRHRHNAALDTYYAYGQCACTRISLFVSEFIYFSQPKSEFIVHNGLVCHLMVKFCSYSAILYANGKRPSPFPLIGR